jgi:hypothetical protein
MILDYTSSEGGGAKYSKLHLKFVITDKLSVGYHRGLVLVKHIHIKNGIQCIYIAINLLHSVLLVEETVVPRENHRPVVSH